MSHMLKLFKIVHRRIYRLCEETQTDTRIYEGCGHNDSPVLFAGVVPVLQGYKLCYFRRLYTLSKAFDKIQYKKMMQILRNTGIDSYEKKYLLKSVSYY